MILHGPWKKNEWCCYLEHEGGVGNDHEAWTWAGAEISGGNSRSLTDIGSNSETIFQIGFEA